MDKDISTTGDILGFGIMVAALAAAMFGLSGCGVMGVRSVDAWGLKVDFAEGVDFHVGANSIDNVQDKRGVSPIRTQPQARPAADKY